MKWRAVLSVFLGMVKKNIFIMIVLFSYCCRASDSWYAIKSYEGVIGSYPVKLVLQFYKFDDYINVKGSYYYVNYHAPIPLYGKKKKGKIDLCEVSSKSEYENYMVKGGRRITQCNFQLVESREGLKGIWVDRDKYLKVSLFKKGSIDKDKMVSKSGDFEIPFWGQTLKHSFIGIYENNDNGLAVKRINIFNKEDGRLLQVLKSQDLGCNFGFYMTTIFQNIESLDDSTVSLNCYSTNPQVVIDYRFDAKKGRFVNKEQ